MNGLPYYPRYPRDFLEGTAGWPLELKGAYAVLLDLIYLHNGALADEPRFIAGHLGCSVRAWNLLRAQLIERGKITCDLGIISNFRADNLLKKSGSYQDKQREKAGKRWKNNSLPDAAAHAAAHAETMPYTDTDTDKKKESATHSDVLGSNAAVSEPKISAPRATRFQEFWNAYPHRDGKRGRKTAEAKYAAAVRRGVAEEAIIAGAIRAQSDPRVIRGFARDPTTWLNQCGWEDEPAPPDAPPPGRPPAFIPKFDLDKFEEPYR